MKFSKKESAGLLAFISDLTSKHENVALARDIVRSISYNVPSIQNSIFRHQHKQMKIKGRQFYKELENVKLQTELIEDYAKGAVLWNFNDIPTAMFYVFRQYENLLNYYCMVSNAHKKIELNKTNFKYYFDEKFIVTCYNDFFTSSYEKEVHKVSFWSKLVFWMIDAQETEWEKKDHKNISSVVSIRNYTVHRSSEKVDNVAERIIESLKIGPVENIGFYYRFPKVIVESIKNIDTEVKKIEFEHKYEPPNIKVVGKIDLPDSKKKRFGK